MLATLQSWVGQCVVVHAPNTVVRGVLQQRVGGFLHELSGGEPHFQVETGEAKAFFGLCDLKAVVQPHSERTIWLE